MALGGESLRHVSQCLICVLMLVSPAARAQDYFGAIAYSPKEGARGWATNHPSRQAAEQAALANCRKFAADCLIVVWFSNGCGALATGLKKEYGSAWGETQAATDAEALKLCARYSKNCLIKQRVCTAGKEDAPHLPKTDVPKTKASKGSSPG